MSKLWNDVKKSYANTPLPEVDETDRAIMDIENKKRTITQAANNELQSILEKMRTIINIFLVKP